MKQKRQPQTNEITLLYCSKVKQKQPYRKPDAVKLLELLIFQDKRSKYPSIPIDYLAPVTYRDNTANGLTKCICDFLRIKGHQSERINTTGRAIDRQTTFTDVTGRMRTIGRIEWIKSTSTNGSADISATIAGRSVKIEVKINDRQSQAQKEYQQAVEAAGGIYYIARDFSNFLSWYNQYFAQ